jgi:hypothetical protein
VAGKPLTEEMKGDFSKIGKGDKIKNLHINFMDIDKLTQIFQIHIEFRDEFIPWDKQDPTLHEGDIKLVGDKNAILSNSYRWANAQIPYVISADYS